MKYYNYQIKQTFRSLFTGILNIFNAHLWLTVVTLIFFLTTSFNTFAKDLDEIIILVSSTNSFYMKGITGFQASFKGKSKVVFLQDIQTNEAEEKDFFEQYENANKPFIVTFGREATQAALSELSATPILFSFVNSSRTLFTGNEKLCGYDWEISIREYFKVLKEIKPTAKKVYSLYSSDQGRYMIQEGEYEDIYQEMFLSHSNIGSNTEFANSFASIIEGADAFLMVPDPIYDEANFLLLSEYCKEHGIVLMTSLPALVDLGATFAIVPDYTSVGEQSGKMANDLFNKKIQCSIGPVLIPNNQKLYVNEEFTKSSGITIPQTVLNKVKSDKLLGLGIELYYKELYQSAKNAFLNLLKIDPSSESAKSYLKKIKFTLTKGEYEKLFTQAENFMKINDYKNAAENYKKILQLFPENKDVLEQYNNAIFLESEKKRIDANSFYKKGEIFDSIRKYLESIKVFPTNNKAKSELQAVRSVESKKTNTFIQQGLLLYNARKYNQSIASFENILLLDPDNKIAIEYLRLSKIKKESYEKLIRCQKENLPGCELLK